jgi:translocation and assembly module TamA
LIKACLFLLITIFLFPGLLRAEESVRVAVEGPTGKALDNVEAALVPPTGIVKPDGTVDRNMLAQFEKRIPAVAGEALRPYGYYDARTEVSVSQEDDVYVVHVAIAPGRRIHVTSVDVRIEGPGAAEAKLQDLVRSFPLHEEDVFLSEVYEKAKADLQAQARSLGYLDADFPLHTVNVSLADRSAAILLTLATGPRYFFGGVTFSGAPRYPEPFLRRYLSFKKGEPFSYARLGQTRTNLYDADRFREVIMNTDRRKAVEQEIPVAVNLTPSPERRVKTGVGYATDTGARFVARYQDVNVMKQGHEFRAELNIAERLLGVAATYIIPSPSNLRTSTVIRAGLLREMPDTYTSDTRVIEVAREHGFGTNAQGALFFSLLDEHFTVGDETSSSFLLMPGVRLHGQRLDSLIRPTKGYRFAVELRGTDTFLGSSTGLAQVLPLADVMFPLPGRFTVLVRSQGGFTFQRQAFEKIPASLRFFAGGDRSVRGYAYQSLGPRDAADNVIGGKYLLFGSIEVEKAIAESWGVAAFYDAGNAFDALNNITFAESAGIGIRYYTRVGPLRLDIARQVNEPSPAIRFHFSVGVFL